MSDIYNGTEPFDGLTSGQVQLIETACKQAPAELHDGIWRAVYENLTGADVKKPSVGFSNSAISQAVQQAFADNGLPLVKVYY